MASGLKRNIQEIYAAGHMAMNGSAYPMPQNGGQMMPAAIKPDLAEYMHQTPLDPNANQDVKKSRLDPQSKQDPSRVLHLRNIPQQLSESEVLFLGLAFGMLKNVLFLRSKNQAFLEFESLSDAQQMVAHFSQTTSTFNGKKIFVQFSNHQELNTDPNNSNNLAAKSALAEALTLWHSAKHGAKNTVLRATILNMIYPVTLDVLNQIFSKFGQLLKIITFNKNDKFQALIQMKDPAAAQNAKQALQGQNIYNGCCTLQIEFSKLASLEVRFNNDKSRDFTNLLLPTGDGMQQGGNDVAAYNMNGPPINTYSNQSGIIGASPNFMQAVQAAANQMPFGAQNASAQFQGGFNFGQMGNMMQQSQQSQMQAQYQQGQQQMSNQGQYGTPVLLVSNLNEEFVNPDALFTLFGVYGDVVRVKILFNKKDSALINFSNAQHASTALANLDRIKLWSKQIRVFPSKHLTVQMPKDGQPDAGLTKDFSNSPLHRFKKPGSKNFNNIFPPSATLHLSNIPQNVTEQQLKDIFGRYGTIKAFKFFQKDRKMALCQMSSIEEATHALILTHNYQLADNMHLRVTFSKATI
ncbi:polypyrimidine tract-binding 1-like isoform X4 [Brachionus plicatilis]|uniref:Polypyrimidine tract-binding 1-like isoform X4 n=1 Tax=Brachionus plicatilis TaxID=10195 RepID=A0A3M7PSZ3_BRAPC|nr:polypyrimidine tract-binding 1-like isoform X4 [Brachionus plicatilis]